MERVTQNLNQSGIPVSWSEIDGQPLALITIPEQFASFGEDQIVRIESIVVEPGQLTISGTTSTLSQSNDSASSEDGSDAN